MFQPFQRLVDHQADGTGVGLGLAIARGFVDSMGGELTLDDTPGGGVTMVVELPVAPDPEQHVTRVLIVDDEAPMRRALAANLRARGYDVDLAETGEQALALAARHHPDVVLLDLGLPNMDGLEVIDGLRGWTRMPIVVLSARGSEADKVAALDAGADDYVSKPFGMDELLARLRAAVRRSVSADDASTVTTDDFSVDLAAKQVLDRRRGRGPADPDRVAAVGGPRAQPRASSSRSNSWSGRCGVRASATRPTARCASTLPTSGGSSSRTMPVPAI